ncbi:hypothetical protein FPOAC1_001946 [Fusarium poae]|uniref:hypothetical protein n=1 Tax=Fusarium poae TaxID=36050 RepID=UPI001CEA7AC3|nr:hypothetical protein FPOAC1_001946 [Fusarium poae]KAG8675950.1 hypothetical protein FPOAC1_001946 [Fusarium poae]
MFSRYGSKGSYRLKRNLPRAAEKPEQTYTGTELEAVPEGFVSSLIKDTEQEELGKARGLEAVLKAGSLRPWRRRALLPAISEATPRVGLSG